MENSRYPSQYARTPMQMRPLFSTLKSPRCDSQNNNQTTQYQSARDGTDYQYAAPTGGELAPYNVVLGLEVAVEADEEDDDRDADEGCAEGLADVAEACLRGSTGVGGIGGRDGGVETEELGYCDADASEGKGGAEPGEEGALCNPSTLLAPNRLVNLCPRR